LLDPSLGSRWERRTRAAAHELSRTGASQQRNEYGHTSHT
jgi:hypothetical protein